MYVYLFLSLFRDLESGLSNVAILTLRLFVMLGERAKTNRTISQLVSFRTAEGEQLHQVKRMIKGIGHVLCSTYSQT